MPISRNRICFSLSVAFLLSTAVAVRHGAEAASPPSYAMTVLPGFQGPGDGEAAHINNNGQVAGWSYDLSGEPQAVLWVGGVLRSLGPLPGGTQSKATAERSVSMRRATSLDGQPRPVAPTWPFSLHGHVEFGFNAKRMRRLPRRTGKLGATVAEALLPTAPR